MNKLAFILALTLISGCAQIKEWVPSFWDPNQSSRIVDLALAAEHLDCDQPQIPQVKAMQKDLAWFRLYSETKGSLQGDVLRLTEPIKESLDDWQRRGEASRVYCGIKRRLLVDQTRRAAAVVQGRW